MRKSESEEKINKKDKILFLFEFFYLFILTIEYILNFNPLNDSSPHLSFFSPNNLTYYFYNIVSRYNPIKDMHKICKNMIVKKVDVLSQQLYHLKCQARKANTIII